MLPSDRNPSLWPEAAVVVFKTELATTETSRMTGKDEQTRAAVTLQVVAAATPKVAMMAGAATLTTSAPTATTI